MTSQASTVQQKIKDMIFHMELLPGTHIPELSICEKLSVSRTPVREALRRLEAEGLVEIEINCGATVKRFSDKEIREIGEIRLAQDILAAQLAAYYGSAAEFKQLEHLADVCEDAAAKGDVYMRIQADIDFHLAISQISKNRRLVAQQKSIYQLAHLIHIIKYTSIEDSMVQISHHRPIIDAIRTGNIEQIKKLIREHIREFYLLDTYLLACARG